MSQNVPKRPISENQKRAPRPATAASSAPNPNPDPSTPPPLPDLKPRQAAALNLLLTGSSDTDVAATLGLNRRTLYRWRTHPGPFRDHLELARRDLFDQSAAHLLNAVPPALRFLTAELHSPDILTAHRSAVSLLRLSNIASRIAPDSYRY